MADTKRVQARFEDFERFKDALRKLKDSAMRDYEAYGPTNLQDIEDLMPPRRSLVRHWATSGGIIGLASFWLMCVWSSVIYNLVVGGKPPISNVPYVIPAYEGTILLGSIGAFVAAILYALLGLHNVPPDFDPRFTQDSYGIQVQCKPSEEKRIIELLNNSGAVEVYEPEH